MIVYHVCLRAVTGACDCVCCGTGVSKTAPEEMGVDPSSLDAVCQMDRMFYQLKDKADWERAYACIDWLVRHTDRKDKKTNLRYHLCVCAHVTCCVARVGKPSFSCYAFRCSQEPSFHSGAAHVCVRLLLFSVVAAFSTE